MDQDKKTEDMLIAGVRSDRIMTPLEVQRAAMNYKAVKQAAESEVSPDILEWIIVGATTLAFLGYAIYSLFV